MVLGIYDYVYGIAQLSAGFLAVIAGAIAISMFKVSRARKELRAWTYLLAALVLFVVVEVIGAFRTFGFSIAPFWTHVLVSVILLLLIAAVVVQIHVNQGWVE